MELKQTKLLVLTATGRLDSASSQELETQLSAVLGEGENQLLLDLFEVEYLSSAGLRVLLMTAKKIQATHGRMILCAVPDHVQAVLDMAGFSRVLETSPTVEEAVRVMSVGEDDLLVRLAARARKILADPTDVAGQSGEGLDLAVLRAEAPGEAGAKGKRTPAETAGGLLDRLIGGARRVSGRFARRADAKSGKGREA